MPIPRRFDRRPPERDQTRINERIGVPQVRLVGDDGNQIGVVSRDEALAYARERDLDLVEVAAEARPPVCRVLDYSKYKYDQEQKAKAARKHQKSINVREIKLRPKIATGDYETKKGHVERFLKGQDKVKVTIMFRGRETTHPERGENLLLRLAEDVADYGAVEQRPTQDGRNMTMLLGPVAKRADGEQAADGSSSEAEAPAGDPLPGVASVASDRSAPAAAPVEDQTAAAAPESEPAGAALPADAANDGASADQPAADTPPPAAAAS